MILGIDHIVIAVHNLDAAIETYGGLGFTVVEGGRHPYGSHNSLIGFADCSYIELLAFYEDSPAHPWWDLLHKRGGGLIDFCMATDDIRSDLAAFHANGVDAGDLTDGGRRRPDGYEVQWINNKVGGDFQGVMPFIIEDVTPREERLPKATAHTNGVTGIHCLSLATASIERDVGIMSAVLKREGQPFADDTLGASGIRFAVGTHQLEYLAAKDKLSPVQAHLAANAPATYAVSFNTTVNPTTTFSPDQTEGVNLEIVKIECQSNSAK